MGLLLLQLLLLLSKTYDMFGMPQWASAAWDGATVVDGKHGVHGAHWAVSPSCDRARALVRSSAKRPDLSAGGWLAGRQAGSLPTCINAPCA